MTTGSVSTVPFPVYLKDSAISASGLKIIQKCGPQVYWSLCMDPDRIATPPTAAMLFGTFIHTALLEPTELAERYMQCGPRNTKAGKEEALYIKSRGMQAVNPSDWKLMEDIVESVLGRPEAAKYLESDLALTESSYWWEDEKTGLNCKARADLVLGDTIVDLKTCAGPATPKEFAKTVFNFGYHLQAAHYLRGVGAKRFVFLVVEKTYPFSVGLFELDQDAIDLGNEQIDQGLALIAECHRQGEWPGYADEISTISLPRWAFYK